jgi:hypothetical protein
VVAEDEVEANELLALMPPSHRKALAKMGEALTALPRSSASRL